MHDAPGIAPAKINLCLHVTGRRPDGYHLLDSLAIFAGAADTITARPAPDLSLRLSGPFGRGLDAGPDNLVLKAAALLRHACGIEAGAALHLDKHLPLAAGIGGGSADAAATLRVLMKLWSLPTDRIDLHALALRLGADVPVCLARTPARMQGIGDIVTPIALPLECGLLLANPRQEVPTARIFAALRHAGAGLSHDLPCPPPPPDRGLHALVDWLGRTTNDLQAPAIALCPAIAEVLAALHQTRSCRFARMSGSGATSFALFDTQVAARQAANSLQHTGWWLWAGGCWSA